jgi:CTP:molybdopterin cytidylyltransferase MocA
MIPDHPPVVAILLAAGLSRRMGRPKQTLAWGESTLVMAVGAQIAAMGLPVVAVVPQWLKEPVPLWARAWIANPEPEQGLSGSIRLGVKAAEELGHWEAMAFFLADQPFVTEADAAAVLEAFWRRKPAAHAVRPLYNGHPGHPVVVDRTVWTSAEQSRRCGVWAVAEGGPGAGAGGRRGAPGSVDRPRYLGGLSAASKSGQGLAGAWDGRIP